jgi:hypothetical protein
MNPDIDSLDDVIVDIADAVMPEAKSRHLMRRRLKGTQPNFIPPSFETLYPSPRRLDIGAGLVRETNWIALDSDPRTAPDLLMDAQSLYVPDEVIDEARMVSALSCFQSPARGLREAWRVLRRDSVLTITEPYAFSTDTLPTVQSHLSLAFWYHVTRDAITEYIPANVSGCWSLVSYKREVHRNMVDQVCRKLKFTEEQAISLMPTLVKKQVVVLKKVML